MFRTVATLLAVSIGTDVLGRAAILTTLSAVQAVSRIAWRSSVSMVRSALRFLMEKYGDSYWNKMILISWSEEGGGRVTARRERAWTLQNYVGKDGGGGSSPVRMDVVVL